MSLRLVSLLSNLRNRRMRSTILSTLAFLLSISNCGLAQVMHTYHGKLVEERAIYANPVSVAYNDSSVDALVQHCRRAHIHIIILLVKDFDGRIYYDSKEFPECIAPKFRHFDALGAVIKEAHKYGIKVHAWFCDFTERPDGPAMKQHPGWAMLNPDGKTVAESEYLNGGMKYPVDWMDPGMKPGYADGWLIPMMLEVARDYDVDGIHHDYERYPGDLAPDRYSFDNYTLRHLPRFEHLYYKSFPDSVFPVEHIVPRLEGDWWSDPSVLPEGWFNFSRKQKASFLLKGSFIHGGAADMNYFFYTYRTTVMTDFIKEVWEKVHAIRPNIEISASVQKDPFVCGRFLGQQWMNFAPWVDILFPEVYRSLFPKTNFKTFLTMFGEYVRQEYEWAHDRTNLAIGFAVDYLYNEERVPPTQAVQELDSLKGATAANRRRLVGEIENNYRKIRLNVRKVDPGLDRKLAAGLNGFDGTSESGIKDLSKLFNGLNIDAPKGYYPAWKLKAVIDTIRAAGGNGIAIFIASTLSRYKLWPVLYQEFKEPSIEPVAVTAGGQLNVVRLRMLQHDVNHYRGLMYLLGIIAGILLIIVLVLVNRIFTRKGNVPTRGPAGE